MTQLDLGFFFFHVSLLPRYRELLKYAMTLFQYMRAAMETGGGYMVDDRLGSVGDTMDRG